MFRSSARVGIWLDDTSAEAAVLRRTRKGWEALSKKRVPLSASLPDAEAADLRKTFSALWKQLPAIARRADTPVYLAMPDAHVIEEVLTFEDFPARQEEAAPLVRQRCARELGRDPESLAITSEVITRDDTGVLCRVRVIDRALRDRIEDAAQRAGFRLTRLDGWLGYATADPAVGNTAFALWADANSWTLACASDDHPQGFSDTGALDDSTAREQICRLVRSYAHRQGLGGATLLADAEAALLKDIAKRLAQAKIKCRSIVPQTCPKSRAERVAAWA